MRTTGFISHAHIGRVLRNNQARGVENAKTVTLNKRHLDGMNTVCATIHIPMTQSHSLQMRAEVGRCLAMPNIYDVCHLTLGTCHSCRQLYTYDGTLVRSVDGIVDGAVYVALKDNETFIKDRAELQRKGCVSITWLRSV